MIIIYFMLDIRANTHSHYYSLLQKLGAAYIAFKIFRRDIFRNVILQRLVYTANKELRLL